MRSTLRALIVAALLAASAAASHAAGYFALAGWRMWSYTEADGGNPDPFARKDTMRVFVFDELGRPMKGVHVHWDWKVMDTQDCGSEQCTFGLVGSSQCQIWCSDNIGSGSDRTPTLTHFNAQRSYDVFFMFKADAVSPGSFDQLWWNLPAEDWLAIDRCPSTYSLTMNTPKPSVYDYGGARSLANPAPPSLGQTFTANADRAVLVHTHLTKGGMAAFRYAAQIFEGGPDGPPVGPRKNLSFQQYGDDVKFFLAYGTEECALQPGGLYYLKFTPADGTWVNGYECIHDEYPYPDFDEVCALYENDSVIVGRDLQCQVAAMSSGNSDVGTIAGTVTNADAGAGENNRIEEAHITVSSSGRVIRTGKLGAYVCHNIPPGTYSITASADGYQPQTVTNCAVDAGHTLTTDFALHKDPGPMDVTSVAVTSPPILPGATGIPVAMTVQNTDAERDLFVDSATLTFWNGSVDCSSFFDVHADPANPTSIHVGETKTFDFTVDSHADAPARAYTVQGKLYAFLNLQPNGSFEQDESIPTDAGPTGWDWHSDDAVAVARLCYQHQLVFSKSMARTVTKATARWIGAWTLTGSQKHGLKVYPPQVGSLVNVYKLKLDIRADGTMKIGTGTPDNPSWAYTYVPGRYYQIDASVDGSDGRFTVDITPLQNQQPDSGHITGTALLASDSPRIDWGKMSDSGLNPQLATEFCYWLEDTVNSSCCWDAMSGYLPTDPLGCGWTVSGCSDPPCMTLLPGVPWPDNTFFHVTTASGNVKEGGRAMQVFCAPTGGADDRLIFLSTGSNVLKPLMTVKPSTTYRVSYWYKQGHYTGSPAYLRTWWEMYDAAGHRFYYEPNTGIGYRPPFHWDEREEVSNGEWRYVEYTFTTQPDTVAAELLLRMDKRSDDPVQDVFTFDDFRMTEINSYGDVTAASPGAIQVFKPVPSVVDAKKEPNGAVVRIDNVSVTGKPEGASNRFYIEDANRVSGLAVDGTGADKDDVLTIFGTVATVDGERCLTDISITAQTNTPGSAPKPLGLVNKALGGAALGDNPGVIDGLGLSNVGLLVTVWGTINNAGSGFFYVDDGSGLSDGAGTGVKVIASGISVPEGKTYACVIGFSSVESGRRVIRPRSPAVDSITWY